jgi:hypothetical protein
LLTWETVVLVVLGWAGFFVLGVVMALYDGALPDGPACGRLALTSLLCCLLAGVGVRYRPDNRAARALAAAALGFPFGVVALGVVTPLEPWPPAAPMWWIFGLVFAFGFAWSVISPE